jgi:thymidylate synthase (FAD)
MGNDDAIGDIMKVKLIGYTQPVEGAIIGIDDVQDLIAYCARVSNPSNQLNQETAPKLLGYLAKHKHWSPFEMASATLEIQTTRDIARQMLRHRSFSFQEFSQRYAEPYDLESFKENSFVIREARMQDTKNRQNSIEATDLKLMALWEQYQERVITEAKNAYDWAIKNGIAKEQARAVLPEGNTRSRLYMSGTIRSWIHFIELRSGNGTQKEHMEVAREVANAINSIFPLAKEYVSKD